MSPKKKSVKTCRAHKTADNLSQSSKRASLFKIPGINHGASTSSFVSGSARKKSLQYLMSESSFGQGENCPTKIISDSTMPPTSLVRDLEAAWVRGLEKYSPRKYTKHSPVKPLEANLKPKWNKLFSEKMPNLGEELISGLTWTVNMTEQFFYDNSLILLSKYREDREQLSQVIRINSCAAGQLRQRLYEDYVQLKLLGEGAFGKVFRATDVASGDFVAIKLVNPCKATKYKEFFKQTLEYMMERNYLIRSRNSPFMVHFYFSFFEKKMNTAVLVFECCIGDLFKLMQNWDEQIEATQRIVELMGQNSRKGLERCYKELSEKLSVPDLRRVLLIYILELFCGIDFLVQCNIVHRDMKPENVMVTANGHLKLADFGLVRNSHFQTAKQQVEMVTASELDNLTNSRYEDDTVMGTTFYFDMEMIYATLNLEDVNIFKKQATVADISKNSFDSCFLSDVWATALVAIQVLLVGDILLTRESWPDSVPLQFKIPESDNVHIFILAMTLWKRPYSELLQKKLVEFAGPQLRELVTFLVSLLRPRANRGQGFTAEKEVLILDKRLNMTHLDLAKIASIDVFRNSGVTPANVFLLPLPVEALVVPEDHKTGKVYSNFGKMVQELSPGASKRGSTSQKRLFPMDPGIDISIV